MQTPESSNKRNNICRKLSEFRLSGIAQHLIYPIIIGLPAYLIVTVAAKGKLLTQAEGWIGSKAADYINSSALQILVIVYLLSVFGKLLAWLIDHCSKPNRELSREDILSILKSIEPVVDDKSRRFEKYARDLIKGRTVLGEKTFSEITQPEQQISLLIAALKSALEYIDKTNASFRIGIVIVNDNIPSGWGFYVPQEQQPSLTLEQLKDPRTTIMHAINDRNMVIVEDIVKEIQNPKPRYLKNGSHHPTNGSLLCYPIIHPVTQQIEYVLTIAGDQKGCLAEKHAPLYSWVLRYYVSRIQLEHSLLIIKQFPEEDRDDYS